MRVPSSNPELRGRASRQLKVVLFSGGRGSGALSRQLVVNPAISLTVAINGYNDGASTGEVRRFLRDCLGPSDFRKNASRLAAELHSCDAALIELLDLRFPDGASEADARRTFTAMAGAAAADAPEARALADRIDPAVRDRVALALRRFADRLTETGDAFNFSDCSLGNLVFAGLYLQCDRDFNRAVDEYSGLVGLPPGLIENVTDGTNAWLVGLDAEGRLLATEEEMVSSARPRRVRDIFLIDAPLRGPIAQPSSSHPPRRSGFFRSAPSGPLSTPGWCRNSRPRISSSMRLGPSTPVCSRRISRPG